MQNNIKLVRQRQGMSQTELAKESGLSRVTISEVELKGREISIANAMKISKALGASLDTLFNERNEDGEPRTTIRIDDTEIRTAQKEVVKLFKALEKANSLVDELASKFKN